MMRSIEGLGADCLRIRESDHFRAVYDTFSVSFCALDARSVRARRRFLHLRTVI
ncbi:MAG: hypothetical protein ACKVT0_08770 [Planctomycetaceae bacterium]